VLPLLDADKERGNQARGTARYHTGEHMTDLDAIKLLQKKMEGERDEHDLKELASILEHIPIAMSHPGRTSTIDLTLTNNPCRLVKCHLHQDNFGSDHRATVSEWKLQPERTPDRPLHRVHDRADREMIGKMVQRITGPTANIESAD
jgi:hypothetical protein